MATVCEVMSVSDDELADFLNDRLQTLMAAEAMTEEGKAALTTARAGIYGALIYLSRRELLRPPRRD